MAETADTLSGRRTIVLAGGPGAGKTTRAKRLAKVLGRRILHTDDLIAVLPWSQGNDQVSQWIQDPGEKIIEGARAVYALRRWLARGAPGAAETAVVWLGRGARDPDATEEQRAGRRKLAEAITTVWKEILPKLRERGVLVIER